MILKWYIHLYVKDKNIRFHHVSHSAASVGDPADMTMTQLVSAGHRWMVYRADTSGHTQSGSMDRLDIYTVWRHRYAVYLHSLEE